MKKRLLTAAVLFLLAFISIGLAYDLLSPVNRAVRSFMAANPCRPFYPVAMFLHYFFETGLGTLQTLAWGAVLLFLYRSGRSAALLVFSMLLQSIAVSIVKLVAAVPRPPQEFFGTFYHSFSYPSGHTCTAVMFTITLAYIFCGRLRRREGRFIAGAYALAALATAYSRMYLDVHWMLDIVGGMLLAGFFSSLLVLIDRFYIAGPRRQTSH